MAAQPRVPALEAASLVPRGDGNSAKEPQTQLAEPASDSKEDSAQAPSAEELLVRWKPYKQNTRWAGRNHPLQPCGRPGRLASVPSPLPDRWMTDDRFGSF